MAKKKQDLTPEERLAAALVPEEEWPYALPNGWKWVRLLGGAATCMDNKRKPVNSKERANRIGEIPYYGATGQVGWIDEYLTNEELILLGEDGAPFLDILKTKAYIISGKSWVNNHAHILKSFMGHIGNLYLMYYLNNFDYRKYVSGTTRLKLTQGKMKNIPVPYPPLSEQRRLVARIESLFAKLDAAKEKVQSVLDFHETRKAALLHDAFTGKLTARWREEQGLPEKIYKTVPLNQVCDSIFDGDHMPPPKSNSGIPFLVIANVNKGKLNFTGTRFVPQDYYESLTDTRKPQNGDVLYTLVGTYGIPVLVDTDEKFCFQRHMALLKPNKSSILQKYLWYTLQEKDFYQQATKIAKGTAQLTVPIKGLRQLTIPLPSLPEQQEIVRILDRLLAREQRARQTAEETLTAIDRMKQAILARAFRGEL